MISLRYPEDGSVVDTEIEEPRPGTRTVLFGPNGSGKTTAVRLLAGTLPGGPALDASYLPQVPYLFTGLAGWNLGLGLDPEAAARAGALARRLGLEEALSSPAHRLSGGQRQRLALARALAAPRPIVLLDEPLAAVDAADRMKAAELIVESIGPRAAVVVTHDLVEAAAMGTHLAVMESGRMIESGPIGEVLSRPTDEAVARLVGVANIAQGDVIGVSGDVVEVRCGGVVVTGVGEVGAGSACRVMFGAETVALYRPGAEDRGTIRNRWHGVVTEVRNVGRMIEVHADVGIPVVAVVTPGSAEGLAIAPGRRVGVGVKAAAVRVVPA